MDQIILSLGVQDTEFAGKLIKDARQQRINKIQYSQMNPLQKIEASSPTEQRYLQLLERVGSAMAIDGNIVKILTYILIFMTEFVDDEFDERNGESDSNSNFET